MPLVSLVLCTPTVEFLIFILSVSLLLFSKFLSFYSFVCEFSYRVSSANIPVILYSSSPVFIIPYPFHLSPSFFLFPGCRRFHAACMRFFRCFHLCLRLGTLAPSSRWDSEPFNRSSYSAVLALLLASLSTKLYNF